ncbi:MAG TPA: hydroxymyristoyl-ACP dehydratase [Rhodanobacteraceae bacterium]|nr:hydroxymyristoyl-ACP dehydratase [Rhodanobacteraceae bacterium]
MTDAAPGGSVRIAPDHPALPGHFPGNPIVPGVVLLDRIAALIERDGRRLARLGAVKFLAPLRPGEEAAIRIVRDGARVRFHIERDGTPILRGEGELA